MVSSYFLETHSYKKGIPSKHSDKSSPMEALLPSRCEYPAGLTFRGLVGGNQRVALLSGGMKAGNGGISESM